MPRLDVIDDKARLKTLKDALHQFSAPAAPELIERHPNGDVRCFACGHRCLVKPGRDGVCRVRFNDDGTLLVPHGYVGALACDPIEKKPFFHVLPGASALTFGMLGCDFHCGYCFTPDTTLVTDAGPIRFGDLFDSAARVDPQPDGGAIAHLAPPGRRTISGSGEWRQIQAVFRHPYRGPLVVLKPMYLPAIRCTPDHPIYATTDPAKPPVKVKAAQLTRDHWLAVPRRCAAESAEQVIDVAAELAGHEATHRVRWKLSAEHRRLIEAATAAGQTSREIALTLGKSASYVRHVRGKLARGLGGDARTSRLLSDGLTVRFPHERRPGIPAHVTVDEAFATLLGYYCAEGSVVRDAKRPNSYCLNFSFSHREVDRAEEVRDLLKRCLNVDSSLVWRTTTLAVAAKKTSAALLVKALAGVRAAGKRVPPQLFAAPLPVAAAFLLAYVTGDGHRYPNGKTAVTTVSHDLAHGVAFLALRLGHLPGLYESDMPPHTVIQGRTVRRAPRQYSVVWYETAGAVDAAPDHDAPAAPARRVVTTGAFHLLPIRDLAAERYDGFVYNMQVAREHNYLANGLLVANCQNWVTSQMLRDPAAVAPAQPCTPDQLVDAAVLYKAPVLASSYNEPLITSEWAVDVFKAARARGLRTAYVSNGNGTPQVLDFLRPHVDAYKVDLKTFSDKNYRQLGGVLENVCQTIRDLKARDFLVEVVTLVVPDFSDDAGDLQRMADFLASIDPLMPWHVTAFHPDYKFDRQSGFRNTTPDDLYKAVEAGRRAGLKYIYSGNLPGQVGAWEDTRCHACDATLVRRHHFTVLENRVTPGGECPECRAKIPGVWAAAGKVGDQRLRRVS